MSLPSKLLERLKKRGIVKSEDEPQLKKTHTDTKKLSFSSTNCPNKYNIHHDCSLYCETKYEGMQTPSARIKKIYETLLAKYPLKGPWLSVWDSGIARFYFYNNQTNEVAWYPPGHSKFKSTKPINVLKGNFIPDEIDNSSASIDLSNKQQTDNQSKELTEKQLDDRLENNRFDDELNQLDRELDNELKRNQEQRDESASSEQSMTSDQESSSEQSDDEN